MSMRGVSTNSLSVESDGDSDLTMTDAVIIGYFGVEPDDKGWPPLEVIGCLLPGSLDLIQFFKATFPQMAPTSRVGYEAAIKLHGHLGLNPYMIQAAVNSTNEAWASIAEYRSLEVKFANTQAAVADQADIMLGRLQEQHRAGTLSRDGLAKKTEATERWKLSKLADIRSHLQEHATRRLTAVTDAATELLRVFVLVRAMAEEQNMQPVADPALEDTLAVQSSMEVEADGALPSHDDEGMDDLFEELDASIVADMGMLTMQDCIVLQCVFGDSSSLCV